MTPSATSARSAGISCAGAPSGAGVGLSCNTTERKHRGRCRQAQPDARCPCPERGAGSGAKGYGGSGISSPRSVDRRRYRGGDCFNPRRGSHDCAEVAREAVTGQRRSLAYLRSQLGDVPPTVVRLEPHAVPAAGDVSAECGLVESISPGAEQPHAGRVSITGWHHRYRWQFAISGKRTSGGSLVFTSAPCWVSRIRLGVSGSDR